MQNPVDKHVKTRIHVFFFTVSFYRVFTGFDPVVQGAVNQFNIFHSPHIILVQRVPFTELVIGLNKLEYF